MFRRLEQESSEEVPAFVSYEGKIRYYHDSDRIDRACARLLRWVESQTDGTKIPIAFDMEWPVFKGIGPGKTALIQVCPDIDLCYLFHVFELETLPASLIKFISHPKVLLHGVNIKA